MIHESNNQKDLWQSGTYDEISIEFQCRDPQNDHVSSNNNDNNDVCTYSILMGYMCSHDHNLGLSNTGSFKRIIFILLNYCLQIINSSFKLNILIGPGMV